MEPGVLPAGRWSLIGPEPGTEPRPLSGTRHTLRATGYSAEIASIGATLRTLRYAGRDIVLPFDADEVRPAYRGVTLAPWPNRVVDGCFRFNGATLQLPLTEPDRSHALHGLVGWLDFETIDSAASSVTLGATIEPQAGYPWRLRVVTTYTLSERGLTQTVQATNLGPQPAPWGTGPHPYLVAGAGPVDRWTLHLPADQVLDVTPDRLVPLRLADVGSSDPGRFDFRAPRLIGKAEIDHAFTGLSRSSSGVATVTVTSPDGGGAAMSWNASCPWVQIHTADLPHDPAHPAHRAGLAVEPMTCAPDAFNDADYDYDTGVLVLDPQSSSEASWTISGLEAG